MGEYCYTDSSCLTPTVGVTPQTFASALQFFAAAQCLIDIPQVPDAEVYDGETFDFIIIGGGGAGCPLANRLSEVEGWKVLLIEAGGDQPVESHIPGFCKNFYDTEYDWSYYSVNNPRISQAIIGGSTYLPRAKMLGGCTSINGMFWIRGHRQDYQHWYDQGNKHWHPDVVDQYFQKIENLQCEELNNDPTISSKYGHNGPVIVNKFNNSYEYINNNIMKSWRYIGIENVLDINTAGGGSGKTTVTASNGRRHSAATAYLTPDVVKRGNLKIIKHSLATKILINSRRRKAFGVTVEQNGRTKNLYANLEVIASAGAINTPQLLMLSGVGPRKHLQEHNIPCILDAPAVGQNMEDHITVNIPIFAKYPGIKNPADTHMESINYLYNRTGALAQGAFSDILTFFPENENEEYSGIEVLVSVYWKNSTTVRDILSKQYKYKKDVLESFVNPNKDYALYVLTVIFLHPESTGSVLLKSNNPKDKPTFDSNFYSKPNDLTRFAKALKKVAQVVNAPYFKSNGAFVGRINWPECNQYSFNSLNYWKCITLHTGVTDYHNVGTTRMGPDPKTSVVRSDLTVHGIDSLRVVDAGVMPYQLSGNPMATVYMISERVSDLIKEYYGVL